MCDEDDNAFAIGSLMGQMNHDAETDVIIKQDELNLSVDDIEPSILTEDDEHQYAVSPFPEVEENNDKFSFVKSSFEDSFEPQPSPQCQNFTPYYEPSALNYNYKSTPLHTQFPKAMTCVYPQAFGGSSQQFYLKSEVQTGPKPTSSKYCSSEIVPHSETAETNPYDLPFQKKDHDFLNSNAHLNREDSGFDETKTIEYNGNINNLTPSDSDKINFVDVEDQCSTKSGSHDLTNNPGMKSLVSEYVKGNSSLEDINPIESVFEDECENKNLNLASCRSKQHSDGLIKKFSYSDEKETDKNYLKNIFQGRNHAMMDIPCERLMSKTLFNSVHSELENNLVLPQSIRKSFELFNCSDCNYSSYNKSNFKNHLFIHSEKRQFACLYCNYRGKQSAGLRAHMKVHSVEKPFICFICSYRCKRKQNLVQHLRIHNKNRPFPCSYCDYGATTRKSLLNHMIKHLKGVRNVRKEKYRNDSEIKDETIAIPEEKRKSFISSHTNSTSSENVMKCSYCDFFTTRKCALQNHIKTHKDNESELKCLFCDYHCESEEKLATHLSSHRIKGLNPLKSRQQENPSTSKYINPQENFMEQGQSLEHDCKKNNSYNQCSLQCPYCLFECFAITGLKQHINNHSDEDFIAFERHSNIRAHLNKNANIAFKNGQAMLKEENSHIYTDYDHVKDIGNRFDKRNSNSLKNVEYHAKMLQKRRQKSLRYLKWNFSKNKSFIDVKRSEEASRQYIKKGKFNYELNSSSCTSNYQEIQSNKVSTTPHSNIEDNISQTNLIKQEASPATSEIVTERNFNNNLTPLIQTMQSERKEVEFTEREKIRYKDISEGEITKADINVNAQSNEQNHSNKINKTFDDQASLNDNHEFCGFLNETVEKFSEFTPSLLAKFDPLNVSTPHHSNSTPRADSDPYVIRSMNEVISSEDKNITKDIQNEIGDIQYKTEQSEKDSESLNYETRNMDANEPEESILKTLLNAKNCSKILKENNLDNEESSNHFNFANAENEENLSKSDDQNEDFNIRNETIKSPSSCDADDDVISKDSLTGNSYKDDRNASKLYRCKTCDSSFQRKSSLVNHMRSHSKDSFKCFKCPITFKYRRAMQDHEKLHIKEKTFKCTKCNFSSMRKCSLMSHFRCHKKKFKCMYCEFECSLIKKMEKHYLKHSQHRHTSVTRSQSNAIDLKK